MLMVIRIQLSSTYLFKLVMQGTTSTFLLMTWVLLLTHVIDSQDGVKGHIMKFLQDVVG